jgi:hypothetical protein
VALGAQHIIKAGSPTQWHRSRPKAEPTPEGTEHEHETGPSLQNEVSCWTAGGAEARRIRSWRHPEPASIQTAALPRTEGPRPHPIMIGPAPSNQQIHVPLWSCEDRTCNRLTPYHTIFDSSCNLMSEIPSLCSLRLASIVLYGSQV